MVDPRPPGAAVDVEVGGDEPPLPLPSALWAIGRCVIRTAVLLARGRISQPTRHLGRVVPFADGSHGRVYRETVLTGAATDRPVLLIVCFRLRWVRGRGHALFRAESLLNTLLFAGFPGLVSKLWLAHDEEGRYRGVYQWNDAALARAYVRALWWVLALVSDRRSIHSVVVPGLLRDEVLANPAVLDSAAPDHARSWWRPAVRAV